MDSIPLNEMIKKRDISIVRRLGYMSLFIVASTTQFIENKLGTYKYANGVQDE